MLNLLSILAGLYFSLSCFGADFKVSAPSHWQKQTETDTVTIYSNTKSKNQQLILLRKFNLPGLNANTLETFLGEHRRDLANARERMLYQFGIEHYAILALNKKSPHDSRAGYRDMYTIHSQYDGITGRRVQMLERQYIGARTLLQAIYFEESQTLNDLKHAENTLDNFKPVFQATRSFASETADPIPAPIPECGTNCAQNSSRRFPVQHQPLEDLGKLGFDCAQNVTNGIAQMIGAIVNVSDNDGRWRRLGKGEQLYFDLDKGVGYKIDRATLLQANKSLQTFENIEGKVAPIDSVALRAELNGGMSALIAEVRKVPPATLIDRVISGLVDAIGAQVIEYREGSPQTKLRIACELLATSVPPGAVLAKLGAGVRLAAAEASPLAQVAKKLISGEVKAAQGTSSALTSLEAKAAVYSSSYKIPGGAGGPGRIGLENGRYLRTKGIGTDDLPYQSEVRAIDKTSLANPEVPKLEPNSVQRTNIILASDEASGTAGVVRLGEVNGRPVAIKAYASKLKSVAEDNQYILAEARDTKLMSDLGIGPKFHGIYQDATNRWNMVTDVVRGDFTGTPVNAQSFADLRTMKARLHEAGIKNVTDLQIYRTPEGRLQIIDTQAVRHGPAEELDMSFGIQVARLLVEAPEGVGRLELLRMGLFEPQQITHVRRALNNLRRNGGRVPSYLLED